MARAFAEGKRVVRADGIGSVVFAHKTTEGWEALLAGMIRGGWTITGSWPSRYGTEGHRLRARGFRRACYQCPLDLPPATLEDAPVGDWADVLRELPRRVGDWMERLQGEGIRGADLVFACIGPGTRDLQPLPSGRDCGGPERRLARVLGEGLGGRRPRSAPAGAWHGKKRKRATAWRVHWKKTHA